MSDENEDLKKVHVGDEVVTLGDLAGLNMDEVSEQRGFKFPKGDYVWEVSTDPENLPRLAAIGEGDKAKPGIIVPCKCMDVIRVNDSEFTGNEADIIGKVHRETMFLTGEIATALGYFKAFAKDIGAPYSPNLKELIAGMSGTRFSAPISHRKNPNDTDQVFVQINRMKVKPLQGDAGSSIAAAVA